MSKIKYTGTNRSVKIAGVLFNRGFDTDLTAEQAKAVKADRFGKAFLDDGTLVETNAESAETKSLDKMKVNELQNYIADHGGDFELDDNKPELLIIAQAIEDAQAAK